MNEPIRILIVEDITPDAELAQREIRRTLDNCIFDQVDTEDGFLNALDVFQPDLIVSDYRLPSFDGMSALQLTLEKTPLTPVIIFTGSMNEDTAVTCMKAGAADYVIKEHVKRLGQAVIHSLAQKQSRLAHLQAEEARRQSEERYRALAEAANDYIFIVAADDTLLYVNPEGANLLGYPAVDLVGQKRAEFFPMAVANEMWHNLQAVITTGNVAQNEMWLPTPQGQKWIHTSLSPLREANGRITAVLGISRDITQRKEAEMAIQQLADNMLTAQRVAHFGSWEVDLTPDRQPIEPYWWSDECYRIFGYEPGAVNITLDFFRQMIHPDERDSVMSDIYDMMQIHTEFAVEYRIIQPSGEIRHIYALCNVLRHHQTHLPIKLLGIVHDITTQKQADEALYQRLRLQEQLTSIAATVPGLIYSFLQRPDGSATMPYASPAIEDLFGLPAAKMATDAEPLFNLIHPDDVPYVQETIATSARTMTPWRAEYRINHPYKGEVWMEGHSTPQAQPDGNILWHGFIQDITDRKQAENLLRQRLSLQEQLAGIATTVPGMIYSLLMNPDGTLTIPYVSPSLEDVYGLHPSEVAADVTRIFSVIHPNDLPHVYETLSASAHRLTAWQAEYRVQHPRKGEVWVEGRATPQPQPDGTLLWHGFAYDITERKRAEMAVLTSQARLNGIIESAMDAIISLNENQCVTLFNAAAEAMFGCPSGEVLGRPLDRFLPTHLRQLHQEQIAAFGRTGLTRRSMGNLNEITGVRANGEIFPIEASISQIEVGGSKLYTVILRDITERKQTEAARIKLEEQLRQSQKMESVGRLAGGVAHDFNNLLTVIQMYSDLMREQLTNDDPLLPQVNQIRLAAERATSLTRQLLAFSRKQVLAPTRLDVNLLIANLRPMLARLLGEDVMLTTQLQPGLWPIVADAGQLEQAIMNLALNARDAMPNGGQIKIETGNVSLDKEYTHTQVEALSGPYIRLTMTDTGQGMDGDTQVHIFEPFFTTKQPGKGTGLGLSTVHGIVKQSGGDISVYSAPDEGTTFQIYLPATETLAARPSPTPSGSSLRRGHETILLVEDEKVICQLMENILRNWGYTVLTAHHGNLGLAMANQYSNEIDLLVTDVIMPYMGGRELAEQLKILRPQLKVLFISGYTDDAVVQHGLMTAEVAFLAKPFSPSDLATKVREVLDTA